MSTKCFKVSERFPVFLKRESAKRRNGSGKRTKTVYYRSVKRWGKNEWEKTNGLANKKGCYIYFWQDTPIYVGMTVAENGFKNECFHPHKTGDKDGNGILPFFLQSVNVKKAKTKRNAQCNSPLSLLFVYWDGSEKADITQIVGEIESYLIIKALNKNKLLLNSKKTTKKWSIPGFDGDENGDVNSIILEKKKKKD